MRTTLDIDDDVLAAARAIAGSERRSLGGVVSDLARRGLMPPPVAVGEEDGVPIFAVGEGAAPITDQMVRNALEEW